MRKIDILKDLYKNNDLSFAEKIESINHDLFDLSFFLLLCDKKDDFNKVFPIKQASQDLNWIHDYLDPEINLSLFQVLIDNEDFIINLLKNIDLFKEINELSQNSFYIQVSKYLNNSEEAEFIAKIVQNNLLDNILSLSLFDSQFINSKLSNDDLNKVNDFIKNNPDFFTENYFDSLETLSPDISKSLAENMFPLYLKDPERTLSSFKRKFFSENSEDFFSFVNNKINSLNDIQLFEIFLMIFNDQRNRDDIIEQNKNIISKIKENLNSIVKQYFDAAFTDLIDINNILHFITELELQTDFLNSVYDLKGLEFLVLLKDNAEKNKNNRGNNYHYQIQKIIEEKTDELLIKNGDFTKLSYIAKINDLTLNKKEKIDIITNYIEYYITNNKYLSTYEFSEINDFDSIKNEVGKSLIKKYKQNKNKEYLEFIEEFCDNETFFEFNPEKFLENIFNEADADKIKKYAKNKDHAGILKKIFNKNIKENGRYSSKAESLINLFLELKLISVKNIINLIEKDYISLDNELADILTDDQLNDLYKSKKISKIFILKRSKNQKSISKYLEKLEDYEIYRSYNIDWKELPLSGSDIHYLYNRVKDKNNRDIKDFMFLLYSRYNEIMSEDLKSEIYKRCSKLKGFEDILLKKDEDVEDSNKILEKKFTKEISSANSNNILAALKNEEFLSILSKKNILRALSKIDYSSKIYFILTNNQYSHITENINYDMLDTFVTKFPDILIAAIGTNILNESEKKSIFNKHVMNFIEYDKDSHMNQEQGLVVDHSFIHQILEKSKGNLSLLKRVSEGCLNAFSQSNYWTSFYLEDFDDKDMSLIFKKIEHMISQNPPSDYINELISKKFERTFRDVSFSSDQILFLYKFSPKTILNIFENLSYDNIFSTKEAFYSFYKNFPLKEKFKLSVLIENKKSFSQNEFKDILQSLTSEQIKEYFDNLSNYFLRRIDYEFQEILSNEEIDLIINEKNKHLIDIKFWTLNMIMSENSLEDHQLNYLLKDENIKNIYLMTKDQKSKLRDQLLSATLKVKTYCFLLELKDLLNLDIEVLEKLFSNIDTNDLNQSSIYLKKHLSILENFSDEFKISFFAFFNEENQHISLTDFVKLAPKENGKRLNLIKKCNSAEDLKSCLEIEDLTEEEIDSIANTIIYKQYYISRLQYFKTEYISHIINKSIENDHFYIEDNNDEIVAKSGIEIAKFNEQGSDFINFLNLENKNKLLKLYNQEVLKFPKEISGLFDLVNQKFETNQNVPLEINEVLNNSSQSEVLNRLDTKEKNILSSLIKFKVVSKIKASAKRIGKFFSSKNDIKYIIDLEVDEVLISNCSNYYDKDLQKELNKKTKDLEKLLDTQLVPSEERTFGFELEASFNKSKKDMVSLMKKDLDLNHNLIITNEYKSSSGKVWDFKEDSSIKNVLGFTAEIASPILKGKKGIKEAQQFLNYLFDNFNIKTGEETNGGLHVHHDVDDILKLKKEKNNILAEFVKFQESIFSLCDNWRQSNTYCSRINFKDIESDRVFGKYVGFNLTEYGTMEFRMRENLNDAPSIVRWIIITQNVVESVASQLQGEKEEFIKNATNTLDLIEKEKLLQIKKNQENDDSLNITDILKEFRNAQIFSKMLIFQT